MQQVNFSLAGRVALITGAGRGIGLGIAQAFAAHGCAVAIQDIDVPVAEHEAAQLRAQGANAIALGGDIGELSQVDAMVTQVTAALGRIDVLVNNASIQIYRPWLEMSRQEIEHQFRADLTAPILLSQAAVRDMLPRRWGRIINIGSIQQKMGNPNMLAYAMSKAALVNLTRALARDLAPHGITANLIAPGWFNTYRNREDFPDRQAVIREGQHVPLGRIGEPSDCAGAALLLAGDAGAYITGLDFYIDGGMSVR